MSAFASQSVVVGLQPKFSAPEQHDPFAKGPLDMESLLEMEKKEKEVGIT